MASCILKQGKQQGSAEGEESARRTSKSSGGERALNGIRLGSWCTRTREREKKDNNRNARVQTLRPDKRREQKASRSHPGGTAFIWPLPLTDRQVAFAAFVQRGDGNLSSVTKWLSGNNNALLESHCWSRRFQCRVLLFVVVVAGQIKKKVQFRAQCHISF